MTIEELFGTLQQAVVGSWRKHLRTAKYGKHVALNDFYEELPDLVDALIEGYMGATGKKIKGFDNIIQSKNMNTLTYLQELKKICKQGYDLLDDNEELEGLLDDMFSGLGQYLDLDVVGDQVLLDQFAAQFELGVRSCREADFDLLEPDLAQVLEELQFFFQGHGHDQSLVTITQVDAAPQRGLFDVVLVGPVEALFGRHEVTDLILADIVHFFPVPFYSIYRFA
jgi:hypothetical protein